MNHTPPPHTCYILCIQLLYCSGAGVTLPQKKKKKKKKGRRIISKHPLPISSKNKLFHLQIYVMLNAISYEIF
jgi:hypothetical protein